MERVNLNNPIYAHLHPLYVDDKCGLFIDKTTNKFISGMFLHFEVVKWSPDVYRQFKITWVQIQNKLFDKGVSRLFATAPGAKEEKLIKMFGFTDSGLTIRSMKLMEKTLCQY